ncbi:hypothetical protein V8F20_007923 [Naviculisporaceae sp. PSN 640]
MHLPAHLLAALMAVTLVSSAPLPKAAAGEGLATRQLGSILETAGDVIGPPLYDLNDELLHPTFTLIEDTVDDVGDIFSRSESSPKSRRQLSEASSKDGPANFAQIIGVGGETTRDIVGEATEGVAETVTAAADVAEDSFEYLFGGATGEKM